MKFILLSFKRIWSVWIVYKMNEIFDWVIRRKKDGRVITGNKKCESTATEKCPISLKIHKIITRLGLSSVTCRHWWHFLILGMAEFPVFRRLFEEPFDLACRFFLPLPEASKSESESDLTMGTSPASSTSEPSLSALVDIASVKECDMKLGPNLKRVIWQKCFTISKLLKIQKPAIFLSQLEKNSTKY